ncbi:cupin domain-containing protein [Virgibacillus halophilus]|uniref:Cupin domain-containing protein n=1 Tax=Tigheibacillus halophilus TaxID=361280 RepID=A0ABU5C2A0_9BACI|nr:cupin domain-containing protein [Virgibacillus halophilus]
MEKKQGSFRTEGLLTLFEEKTKHATITFGTVTIAPGERVPEKGFSKHEENEYAVIISGKMEGESGGEQFSVSESNATFIPAGEQHWTANTGEEPCQIVWALVKSE